MGAIREFVKSAAYGLGTRVLGDANGRVQLPIMAGPAKGIRMRLDLQGRREAYFWGKYDRVILTTLSEMIRPGWTIWDCGTYIGFYTCFFARAVGPTGKVVVIEPDTRNLKRTKENVELNGFDNVEYRNLAIGPPVGRVAFLLSDDTNSHLPDCYVGGERDEASKARDLMLQKTTIECVSFDQAYFEKKLPKPDMIKVDIEGAEKDAVPYLTRLTSEVRPFIVLELHNPECDRAAWEFSKKTGYHLRSLDTGKDVVDANDVNGTLWCSPPS